jgi:hypothetical protein
MDLVVLFEQQLGEVGTVLTGNSGYQSFFHGAENNRSALKGSISDAGCWMLDAGCWMLDAGCNKSIDSIVNLSRGGRVDPVSRI